MDHVGSERFAWQYCDHEVAIVGIVLMSDAVDLAHLLRTVQVWLVQSGLKAIRFELDDRTYVLEARRTRDTRSGVAATR